MTRGEKIRYGLLILVVIIGAVLLTMFFKGSGNIDELIKAKDETIKAQDKAMQAIRGERDAYVLMNKEKDKSIAESERKDSLYHLAIINNQPKIKANEKRYENIPAVVSSWSKDSLRLAAWSY